MDDDPFHGLNPSREERLSDSPCAGELENGLSLEDSSDSGGIPVESTEIVIVSVPESLEEKDENHEVFHTPPEETVLVTCSSDRSLEVRERWDHAVDVDGGLTAVDLGRETDLEFSEVELKQKIEFDSECDRTVVLENFRVLKRVASSEKGLAESLLKKSKYFGESLCFESPVTFAGIVEQENKENLIESDGNLNLKAERGTPCDSASDVRTVGAEVLDLKGTLEDDSTFIKSEEDLEDVESHGKMGESDEGSRFLQMCIDGAGANVASEEDCCDNLYTENALITFSNVVGEIGEGGCTPNGYENVSILEIAMSRGMTFPRPCWWPETEEEEEG